MPTPSQACPCGRADARGKLKTLAQCCGRYLAGEQPAPDAGSLMRSRYCAFVLENAPYLLATWHASTRPADVSFETAIKWLGLQVRDHREQDSTHAQVEFVARYRLAGRAVRLHERSRFLREDGRWYYMDGDML